VSDLHPSQKRGIQVFALVERSVVVQGVEQSRELAAYCLVTLPQVLVLSGELAVSAVLRLVLGVGRVMRAAVPGPFVLADQVLVAGDLGFVRCDDLLVLQ